MPYPEHFYYNHEQSGMGYSNVPRGAPNILRMIQGKECWPTGVLHERKKKSLLFADWTVAHWTHEKKKEVAKHLNRLLQDGFDLFIWQDGVLHKVFELLLQNFVNCASIQAEMRLVSTEELLDIAYRQHQLNSSAIHILDDFAIQQLINPQLVVRKVDLADLTRSSHNHTQLFALLQQTNPPVTEIAQYSNDPKDELTLNQYSDLIPTSWRRTYELRDLYRPTLAHNLEKTKKFKLNGCNFAAHPHLLQDEHLKRLEHIELSNCTIDENFDDSLKKISSLDHLTALTLIKNTASIAFYDALLNRTPHLTKLELHGEGSFWEVINATRTTLQSLVISFPQEDDVIYEKLLVLLQNNQRLTSLEVNFMSSKPQFSTFLIAKLPILTDLLSLLFRGRNSLSTFDVSPFLRQCPSLTDIEFDCKVYVSSEVSLPELKRLNCNLINTRSLRRLLKHAPKIEYLSIYRLLFTQCEFPNIEFKHLRFLSIDRIEVDSECDVDAIDNQISTYLHSLLLAAPELQCISIRTRGLGSCQLFKGVKLSQVKQFTTDVIMDLPIFLDMFSSSSQLCSLQVEINDGEYQMTGDELNQLAIHQLTNLTMECAPAGLISSLLDNNTALNGLYLKNCEEIAIDDPHSLPFLKEIMIDEGDFSSASFYHLIAQSTALKAIFCHKSDAFNQTWPAALNFPKIIELNISSSTVQMENLVGLFSKARQLKMISLTDCLIVGKNLDMVDAQLSKLETLQLSCSKGLNNFAGCKIYFPVLKRLDLDESDITTENLLILLDACPTLESYSIEQCENVCLTPELAARLKGLENLNGAEPFGEIQTNSIAESVAPQVVAEAFNLKDYFNFKPNSEAFSFRYSPPSSHLKSQEVIISQFSQYVLLTQQNLLLHEINEGICGALCDLHQSGQWWEVITPILSWNGQLGCITDLVKARFSILQHFYTECYSRNKQIDQFFLGDNLSLFLSKMAIGSSFRFDNAWHSLSVIYRKADVWEVYDPNSPEGPEKLLTPQHIESYLRDHLGYLIKVVAKACMPVFQCRITNPQKFFEEGGLVELVRNLKLLQHLGDWKNRAFSAEALQGLLPCDLQGVPVWLIALRIVALQPLVAHMLKQFVGNNPKQYAHQLQQGIDNLDLQKKSVYLSRINDCKQVLGAELCESLKHVILNSSNARYFGEKLSFTQVSKPHFDSVTAYCDFLLQETATQRLIKLNDSHDVYRLKISLEQHCLQLGRPVFVVNSPSVLICSAPFIKAQGDMGLLQNGPGGHFYDFIQANRAYDPVIIVNYDPFKPADYIRLNTLLDTLRSVDGQALPAKTLILALVNQNNPDCYQGSDFYSRFKNKIECCPLPATMLAEAYGNMSLQEKRAEQATYVINLAHCDWKEKLGGRWVLFGEVFVFQQGEWAKACQQGLPVEFWSAPWDDLAFYYFVYELRLQNVDVPCFVVNRPNVKSPQFCSGYMHGAIDINADNFDDIFEIRHFDELQPGLTILPGYVQQFANKQLIINVTHPLNAKQRAILQAECFRFNVDLIVNIPTRLPGKEHTQLIETVDTDVFIHQWCQVHPKTLVIDISECRSCDLLTHLAGSFNRQDLKCEFHRQQGLQDKPLQNSATLILTGTFKHDLIAGLSSFLIQRLMGEAQGQIILVTPDAADFSFMLPHQVSVSASDRRACLPQGEMIFTEADYANISLVHLRAHWVHQQSNASTNNPWQGIYQLPAVVKLGDFDPLRSVELTQQFNRERCEALHHLLHLSPIAVITGLTGTGKTTFMEKVFAKQVGGFYQGIDKLNEWAKNSCTEGLVVLVIDEANMAGRHWSEFESMYWPSRGVRAGHEFLPLRNNQVVIFLINPYGYGERSLPSLFVRHGNAQVFDPLPLSAVYEEVLKPAIACSFPEDLHVEIAQTILEAYRFIVECSKKEVLMTPRDVEMIALLTLAKCHYNRGTSPLSTAQYYTFQLGRLLVPSHYVTLFDQTFKPDATLFQESGRPEVIALLQDILMLRLYRKQFAKNEVQRFGGLGGLSIIGEAGVGKSHLIDTLLSPQSGYYEVDWKSNPKIIPGKAYVRMPASLSFDEKKALLTFAAINGLLVIADELNSSPFAEEVLNHFLMGKDESGQRVQNAGFMILSTGNPVTSKGRREQTNALKRRFIGLKLSSYTTSELQTILENEGLMSSQATELAEISQEKIMEARKNETRVPTIREISGLAQEVLNAFKKYLPKKQANLFSPVFFQSDNSSPATSKHVIHNQEMDQLIKRSKVENGFI